MNSNIARNSRFFLPSNLNTHWIYFEHYYCSKSSKCDRFVVCSKNYCSFTCSILFIVYLCLCIDAIYHMRFSRLFHLGLHFLGQARWTCIYSVWVHLISTEITNLSPKHLQINQNEPQFFCVDTHSNLAIILCFWV